MKLSSQTIVNGDPLFADSFSQIVLRAITMLIKN